MQAIQVHQFGPPEVLQLEEIPTPTLGANQILVQTRAIGVNPVETYIRAGNYGPKNFPFTPGADCAGVVHSVGSGVTQFKPGDRVYTGGSVTGTYAQFTLCNQSSVHPLPDNLSFEQGATLGVPYATAYRAVHFRGRVLPGETFLIHGASGSVGTAATQIARALGAHVLGTAGSDEGMAQVRSQGAHAVFNHKSQDYVSQIMAHTQNRGVDCILELLANVNLDKDLKLLAKYGRVVVVGSRGRIEIDPRDTMSRDADIRGMSLNNGSESEIASIHAALFEGLSNSTLRPITGESLPLSQAPLAHKKVLESHHGKITLIP